MAKFLPPLEILTQLLCGEHLISCHQQGVVYYIIYIFSLEGHKCKERYFLSYGKLVIHPSEGTVGAWIIMQFLNSLWLITPRQVHGKW